MLRIWKTGISNCRVSKRPVLKQKVRLQMPLASVCWLLVLTIFQLIRATKLYQFTEFKIF